jgi:phosphoglycolate phosphatase-like HAD superfamily hydrolase
VIKGRKGYAQFDADTIGLEHRLLERLRVNPGPNRIIFVNYIELRPRVNLAPGEYAIIGDSLADMATFKVR